MAGLALLESGSRTSEKQEEHTMEAAKLLEHDLKSALLDLTRTLFGKGKASYTLNPDRQ